MARRFIVGALVVLMIPSAAFAVEDNAVAKEKSNSTMFSDMVEKIGFKEGSFGDKARNSIIGGLEDMEIWRHKAAADLDTSLDKVKESRKNTDNMKPEIKTMSFLHMSALQVMKFVLLTGFVFYALSIVIALIIIKKFIAFIGWIFRRRADSV